MAANRRALALNPKAADLWYNWGTLLINVRRYDEAVTAYDRALDLHPTDAHAWRGTGTALNERQRFEEALDAYGQALDPDPQHVAGWGGRATALHGLGRVGEAKQAERRVHQLLKTGSPVSPVSPSRFGGAPRHVAFAMDKRTSCLLWIGIGVGVGLAVFIASSALTFIIERGPQSTSVTAPTVVSTAVPTATLAPGFAGFENGQFSIAYPSDWTHSSRTSTLSACTCSHLEVFTGSGNAGNEEVYVGTASSVPSDELTQLIDEAARIRLLSQEVLQPLAPNLHKTYDQQQWIENDYTYTHLQGNADVVIEVRALVVDVGATTYFIVAYAPQASFGSANAAHLEPMLQSFRFQGV